MSVIVAALVAEVHSARVHDWLRANATETISISDWVVTEMAAAISMKVRMKQISVSRQGDILALFEEMRLENLSILSVNTGTFRIGATLASRSGTGLRAGDALHLAIASEHQAPLVTLDRRMHEAGVALGIESQLL